MKRTFEAVLAGLTLIGSSGCAVLEPWSGSTHDPQAPISFRGYALQPEQEVDLESQRRDGTVEIFASTRAGTTPKELSDGTKLYEWSVAAVVPRWQSIIEGCATNVNIEGVSGSGRVPLYSFGQSDAQCVGNELNKGTPYKTAVANCAAQENTSLRLMGTAVTIKHDVLVTSQADAETGALACATVIDGNLTVRAGTSSVSMSHLERVTGDVVIEVEDANGAVGSTYMPTLYGIGGNLRFHHKTTNANVAVDLGLPALRTLPHDLEVVLDSFNGQRSGLPNLLSVAGNVRFKASGDLYAPDLLISLQTIGGDLAVATNAGSSGNFLDAVQTVGGSVSLDGLSVINHDVLNALQSVGGGMTVKGCAWVQKGFAALGTIGGTLRVESGNAANNGPPGETMGSASLSLAALELVTSPFTIMPFPAATTVGAHGAITIINNSRLCQASVDGFVAAQRQAGWSGTLTVSGNVGSCN